MNLGETIYNLRKEKKLSQGDLAEQLSVSRQSVSKWENNSAVPDLDKLVKLSTIFGVSLDELVKGEMPAGEADNGGQAAEAEHTDTAKSIITKRFIVGMVLMATGSGKSTTLASIIDRINSMREVHVITLEDPIEYLHNHKKAMVNQREVGLDTHSYSNALRAALREDPDVILVGEMRDLETISTAITAAETGHLVLSTLHTIGAASTIDRIVDVFPPHQQQQIRVQLSMVLESVISQQLIPTADKKSRVAAFEVMHSTPAIKNLIREAKSPQINSTIQTSKKLGMQTMDDAIFDLYMKGDIDKENAVSYAQDSQIMEKRIDNAF